MFRLGQKKNLSTMTGKVKRLIAIDFDHTIVDANTDIVARELVSSSKIPQSVQLLHKSNGWIPYMQEIFQILYNSGYKKNDILTAIRNIPEVPGMMKCLETLHTNNFDIIIISDSNSEFIAKWNKDSGLSPYVSAIFTNYAQFDQDGLLHVKPFHSQTECSISSINLCKGKVLDDYLEAKLKNDITYENIFYVGDGYHDICPMLRLNENDFACPRINYAAEKHLQKTAEKIAASVTAQVLRWNDGHDLLVQIKHHFSDLVIEIKK